MQPPANARKRALFVSPEEPTLGQGGGGMRSASLLAYLRNSYDVDVTSFQLREHSKSTPARVVRNAMRLLRGVPPLFDRYSGYEDQLPTGRYDLTVVEHFWCASYATHLRKSSARLVLDLHNIESELARTHAGSLTGASRAMHSRFASLYRALEAEWLPRFDTLLVTSEADRAKLSHPDVRVFPNAVPEVSFPNVPEEPVVVFSGNLEYHPNIEAVRWFARTVWPRILEQLPEATWRLVGRNPHAIEPVVRSVPNISVTGPVEDAVAAIGAGRVCVVPLLSGSGTRFKILEAWAAQRAVVSTTIGAEGLKATHGEHLLIADTTEDFAHSVVRLWNDAAQRERLGKAGRALYESRFTWAAAWRTLDQTGGL